MTRLRCLNCGGVFDRKALTTHAAAGVAGSVFGLTAAIPVWPFVLRVFAKCPKCDQTGWIKVLKPWSKT